MEVNLSVVIGSHLNDAMFEVTTNPKMAVKRIKFIKVVTFFNENLKMSVTEEYLDWLWNEIFEKGGWGGPYVKKENKI